MAPNLKELEEKGLDITKAKRVYNMYIDVLNAVRSIVDGFKDINEEDLEIDEENFRKIKQILEIM